MIKKEELRKIMELTGQTNEQEALAKLQNILSIINEVIDPLLVVEDFAITLRKKIDLALGSELKFEEKSVQSGLTGRMPAVLQEHSVEELFSKDDQMNVL